MVRAGRQRRYQDLRRSVIARLSHSPSHPSLQRLLCRRRAPPPSRTAQSPSPRTSPRTPPLVRKAPRSATRASRVARLPTPCLSPTPRPPAAKPSTRSATPRTATSSQRPGSRAPLALRELAALPQKTSAARPDRSELLGRPLPL